MLKLWFCNVVILFFLMLGVASGQTLEPRLYTNVPVGLNFLVVGYGYSDGALSLRPEIGLEDAEITIQSGVVAYGRVLDVAGMSGKVDIIIPGAHLSGTGKYHGNLVSRNVSGLGDIKGRFSLNFYGAPALSFKEFSSYEQDTIMGFSLQVTAPTGQYNDAKLVNIGANRWAAKPSVGISKKLADFTVELSGAAELFTENNDFYGGVRRKQDPVYSTQFHVVYVINKGLWCSVDANYYWGGDTVTDGVRSHDPLSSSRMGATLALALDRHNSLKLYGSSGVNTRTGSDFDLLGVVWQYRWGAGL